MKKKKTWRERANEVEYKIHEITPEWEEKLGKGKILIPNALDIERLINETKKGELLTNDSIREKLAKEKNVQVTAAMPTGVYLKYVALAAEEEKEKGKKDIAPYWRVLKPNGTINAKFPISVQESIVLLESEGHKIEFGRSKKTARVVDFEKKIKKYS